MVNGAEMPTTNGKLDRIAKEIRKWAGAAQGGVPDRDLLRRYVASQDEAAFSGLVKRHGPMVLGVCRKLLRHAQDAEDAFQATFLVLARKATSIRNSESVGGWLYGVAYRVANKLRTARSKRKARETPLPPSSLRAEGRGKGASDELTWREVELVVCAELDRLADKYRAPLVLCYLQGKTRDEAAQQLGWEVGVFRGRLERGRALLRSRLSRRGLTLSAALLSLGIAETAQAALVPPTLFSTTIQAASSAAQTA